MCGGIERYLVLFEQSGLTNNFLLKDNTSLCSAFGINPVQQLRGYKSVLQVWMPQSGQSGRNGYIQLQHQALLNANIPPCQMSHFSVLKTNGPLHPLCKLTPCPNPTTSLIFCAIHGNMKYEMEI